ncbi:MAG: TlpA disulfide reductase family protein [Bacteroidia bacterium]
MSRIKLLLLLIGLITCRTSIAQSVFPLPAFKVTATDGSVIDSSYFRGTITWINFFYEGCAPCMKEIPLLVRLQQYYGEKKLRIIGIAPHSPSQVKAFAERKKVQGVNINYVLTGECPEDNQTSTAPRCHAVSQLFGVSNYPTSVIVDAKGNILMSIEGFPMRTNDEETFQEMVKLIDGFLAKK